MLEYTFRSYGPLDLRTSAGIERLTKPPPPASEPRRARVSNLMNSLDMDKARLSVPEYSPPTTAHTRLPIAATTKHKANKANKTQLHLAGEDTENTPSAEAEERVRLKGFYPQRELFRTPMPGGAGEGADGGKPRLLSRWVCSSFQGVYGSTGLGGYMGTQV
jgi:hypothetical protein